jgi:DNA topoisomerase-2
VIPLALVNGAKGIGTGFSTDIPSYDPKDLIKVTRAWLDQSSGSSSSGSGATDGLVPYFEGFKGQVEQMDKGKFAIRGTYKIVDDNQIHVTELPVGFWTDDFKQLLENLAEPQGKSKKGVVKDYRDMSTDTRVDVTVTLTEPKAAALHAARSTVSGASCTGVEKLLKLCCVRGTSNMNLFDANERLRKFATTQELVDVFCKERLKLYHTRYLHLQKILEARVRRATNKQRFIEALLDGSLDLRGKSRTDTAAELEARKFDRDGGDFKYLTRMPMDTMCKESVDALRNETAQINEELEILLGTTPAGLWRKDLDRLEEAHGEHLRVRAIAEETTEEAGGGGGGGGVGAGAAKKKRRIKRVKKSA